MRYILLLFATPSLAQQPSIPQRTLGPVLNATIEPLGLVLNARRLSDGRVMVNDGQKRRLLLFDSTLTRFSVIADSMGSGFKYPPNASPAIAYIGDTTLFLDGPARALVVLDPNGKSVRIAALPKPADQLWLGTTKSFADPQGRLVYRGAPVGNPTKDTGQAVLIGRLPDSIPVVRASFDTRTVDTVTRIKLPVMQENHNVRQGDGPAKQTVIVFGGLSYVDDWTMTADGTIAAVRGFDYHVDWYPPNGARTSSPKMSFDWQKIDDEEKRRVTDSAAKELNEFLAAERAKPRTPRPDGTMPPRIAARADLATGALQVMSPDATAQAAPLDRLPDYRQPFRASTTLADREGNVWILPHVSNRSRNGGLVYDVVNREQGLVERVELPADRSIIEFGPGGTVYLMRKGGDGAWQIEERRIAR